MVTVQYLNPADLPRSSAYSQAVVVEHPSRTVYVGGQNGVDRSGAVVAGDLAGQTTRAVDNVRVALAAAGGTFSDVISWTVAVVAGQDLSSGLGAMHPALAGRTDPPVVTVLQVAGLAVPGRSSRSAPSRSCRDRDDETRRLAGGCPTDAPVKPRTGLGPAHRPALAATVVGAGRFRPRRPNRAQSDRRAGCSGPHTEFADPAAAAACRDRHHHRLPRGAPARRADPYPAQGLLEATAR